ncbi:hypothetical protein CMUS01_10548 [Colletotrichum musicola]|uniref:DUF6546 domain-containing protein n=1 Tax=Colletotrichum musicola TaxID=2175873 RepID=A0A8H6K3M9_9PEZI|nr:hypothetical protein CMUS01_10548 [Colletotrichum musicola]
MSSQPVPGSWKYLPAEIRTSILTLLVQESESLASFATVSPEWQSMVGHRTFSQITLTLNDIEDFDRYTCRNRALVRFIRLSLSLRSYELDDKSSIGQSKSFYSTLSRWEPTGTLVLAISIDQAPSDLWCRSAYCSLSGNLGSNQPRKLVLLGNFHRTDEDPDWPPRFPTSKLAEGLAHASQGLEQLSVAYVVDASPFPQACGTAPLEWPDLTSLTLTSCLFGPDTSAASIDDMIEQAAEVARRMPKLEVVELWNVRPGLAAAFIYRFPGPSRPAEIAWRGTWEYGPSPFVVRAWEAVALGRGGCNITPIVREILDGDLVESDCDAIPQLKFLTEVAKSTSIGGVDWSEKWDDYEAGHCREAVVCE